jgi:hypothetical protein
MQKISPSNLSEAKLARAADSGFETPKEIARLVLTALKKTGLKTIIPRIMKQEFGMFCGED